MQEQRGPALRPWSALACALITGCLLSGCGEARPGTTSPVDHRLPDRPELGALPPPPRRRRAEGEGEGEGEEPTASLGTWGPLAAPTSPGPTTPGPTTPGPTAARLPPRSLTPRPQPPASAVQLPLTGAPPASTEPAPTPWPEPLSGTGPLSGTEPGSWPESAEPEDAARTSLDHPLQVRWLDLVAAGPRAPRGRIGVCAAPGRRDGRAWARSLGADLDRLVALLGVEHLVLLLDPAEQAALGIADLMAEAEARRIVVHALPLPPGGRPSATEAEVATTQLLAVARAGRRALLVSRDGEERAGTLAAAVLVRLGLSPEAALRAVRATLGPRAAGSEAQRAFVLGLQPPPR